MWKRSPLQFDSGHWIQWSDRSTIGFKLPPFRGPHHQNRQCCARDQDEIRNSGLKNQTFAQIAQGPGHPNSPKETSFKNIHPTNSDSAQWHVVWSQPRRVQWMESSLAQNLQWNHPKEQRRGGPTHYHARTGMVSAEPHANGNDSHSTNAAVCPHCERRGCFHPQCHCAQSCCAACTLMVAWSVE